MPSPKESGNNPLREHVSQKNGLRVLRQLSWDKLALLTQSPIDDFGIRVFPAADNTAPEYTMQRELALGAEYFWRNSSNIQRCFKTH